jgi:hypothetical protein
MVLELEKFEMLVDIVENRSIAPTLKSLCSAYRELLAGCIRQLNSPRERQDSYRNNKKLYFLS